MLLTLLQTAARTRTAKPHGLLHFLSGFGIFGLFAIAIVDASFIPLPIPGCTDILLIIMAARQPVLHTWILFALLATVGSVIGGYMSYRVGAAGGLHMLEKRVPKKYFARICDWTQNNTFLAVALPAFLPPPMPLSIFVLAAGALKVSKRKFLTAFAISRAARHCISAWIGAEFGRHALRAWRNLSAQWATPVEITLWVLIGGGVAYGVWRLWAHIRNDRKLRRRSSWKSLAEDV